MLRPAMSGYLEFLGDCGGDWVLWTPELASSEPEIFQAIDQFESRDCDAGKAATSWLKESALDNHPSTVTQLLVLDGRIEAFFALCSGQVRLSQRQRKRLLRRGTGLYPGKRLHELLPTQPVALIAWLAKHKESDIPGEEILLQASAAALEVIEVIGQGQIAIALDPFDRETSDFWKREFDFKSSQLPKKEGEDEEDEEDEETDEVLARLWRTLMEPPQDHETPT